VSSVSHLQSEPNARALLRTSTHCIHHTHHKEDQMTFTPTPEQQDIVDFVKSSSENFLCEAGAGCTKTSTLEMLCRSVSIPVLALAFNKRIAEEMQNRMPSHVRCSTINSVGHRAWGGRINRRLTLDSKKTYQLLREEINNHRDRSDAYGTFADTLQAIRLAKQAGYVPSHVLPNLPRPVGQDGIMDDISDAMMEPLDALQLELINSVLDRTIKQGFDGNIDYDDQIYLPTMFGGVFPKAPLVLGDEAQDFSTLNHAMLRQLVTMRFGAVGDSNQSIYAFRGANVDSMGVLQRTFNMKVFPLTISFRCPKAVVRLANKHAPQLRSAPSAIEGLVTYPTSWELADIKDKSAILCRNNAPLFYLALQLLKVGRGVKILGADVGPGMIRVVKKLTGGLNLSRQELVNAITKWMEDKLVKATERQIANITDRAECLLVFARQTSTSNEAIAFMEHTFSSEGTITLGSIHKMKGLEYDIVYHVDPWRIPSKYAITPDAKRQEANCGYVATTRTKNELHHINLADMGRKEDDRG
jgi:DNA helicase-2/ATP-dependent DNA helicase PcrA